MESKIWLVTNNKENKQYCFSDRELACQYCINAIGQTIFEAERQTILDELRKDGKSDKYGLAIVPVKLDGIHQNAIWILSADRMVQQFFTSQQDACNEAAKLCVEVFNTNSVEVQQYIPSFFSDIPVILNDGSKIFVQKVLLNDVLKKVGGE